VDGLEGNIVIAMRQWPLMNNWCNGQLDNGQLMLRTVQRLGDGQHNRDATKINGETATRLRLTKAGDGQLA
jgi:hypothetical protein